MSRDQMVALAARAQSRLDDCIDSQAAPQQLHRAMHYALAGGGKRIRPTLIYATAQAMDVSLDTVDSIAVAVEIIHAYSLIHDDLPAMDDDDLRRGKPTCHKAFDEATAILAGDALQALAFEILAADNSQRNQMPALVLALAHACGSRGMAGGQATDLQAVGASMGLDDLIDMHRRKTGALIAAGITMSAIASEAPQSKALALKAYADAVGLAFQIRDDILDVTGQTDAIGKPAGSDQAAGKPTFPATIGLENSRIMAKELCDQATNALESFGQSANLLRFLADYIITRES